MLKPAWLEGYVLDEKDEKEQFEALKKAHPDPRLANMNLDRLPADQRAAMKAIIEGSATQHTIDQGPIRYRRYRHPDHGRVYLVPEGDSGNWLPKAEGFKGGIAKIKGIDGRPRLVSSIKTTITES